MDSYLPYYEVYIVKYHKQRLYQDQVKWNVTHDAQIFIRIDRMKKRKSLESFKLYSSQVKGEIFKNLNALDLSDLIRLEI